MNAHYNRDHPSRRLGFKIGDKLQHREEKLRVTILGWGCCLNVWKTYLCEHQSRCPNAFAVMKTDDYGFNNTGYWCVGHPHSKKLPAWRKCNGSR